MDRIKTIKNLISIEGIDGSGKSTFTNQMKKYFRLSEIVPEFDKYGNVTDDTMKKFDCELRFDRAPFDPIAETYIRYLLSSKPNYDVETKNTSLLYAFISDFILHQKDILNFSEKVDVYPKKIVISDRYLLSTIAYQSLHVPFDRVCDIVKNSNLAFPKVIIYLECEPEVSLKRIEKRGEVKEMFEKLDFLNTIKENYEKGIKWINQNVEDCKIIRVNTSQSLDSYKEEIEKVAELYINNRLYK